VQVIHVPVRIRCAKRATSCMELHRPRKSIASVGHQRDAASSTSKGFHNTIVLSNRRSAWYHIYEQSSDQHLPVTGLAMGRQGNSSVSWKGYSDGFSDQSSDPGERASAGCRLSRVHAGCGVSHETLWRCEECR